MIVFSINNITGLAQLVERWPFKPVVVGSSPISGDNYYLFFHNVKHYTKHYITHIYDKLMYKDINMLM